MTPAPPSVEPRTTFALEAVRAGAALLVLLSHARDMLVRDAAGTADLRLAARAFMALSGFGHQAVIVFFVLSGYLITGSMRRDEAAGQWSLPSYVVGRLTRLWVVLLPCLILGGSLDAIGLAVRGAAAHGPYGIPPIMGEPQVPPALGPGVAVANLLFLQTIVAPVFGSNGALWSLANEAWYYALAGLSFAAWQRRSAPATAMPFVMGAAMIAGFLPGSILALAPVWGFGAAAALVPPADRSRATGRAMVPALAACVAILLASRLRFGPSLLGLDLLLGAAMGLLLHRLAALPNPGQSLIGASARGLSRLSYSLYASHCPVLALFAALAIGSQRRPMGPEALGLVATGMGLCLLVAWALWWAFERHTGLCRRAILGWMGERQIGAVAPAPRGMPS